MSARSVLNHLPLQKFQKPSWTKPPCVLLACGSFSPPTYLHLRIMEEARDSLKDDFDVIGGILSPVHDEYGILHKPTLRAVNGDHRIAMTRLATECSDWIGVSDFEVKSQGWSLVADVMDSYSKALNTHFVGDPQGKGAVERVHLKFLGGTDLLKSMTVPDLWSVEHQEIVLAEHGFVAIERAGDPLDEAFFESHSLFTKHRERIHGLTPTVENTISSTKVRELIKRGDSIKYLLPDCVIRYIQENSLYA